MKPSKSQKRENKRRKKKFAPKNHVNKVGLDLHWKNLSRQMKKELYKNK